MTKKPNLLRKNSQPTNNLKKFQLIHKMILQKKFIKDVKRQMTMKNVSKLFKTKCSIKFLNS